MRYLAYCIDGVMICVIRDTCDFLLLICSCFFCARSSVDDVQEHKCRGRRDALDDYRDVIG